MLEPNNPIRLFCRGLGSVARSPLKAVFLVALAAGCAMAWTPLSRAIHAAPIVSRVGVPEGFVALAVGALLALGPVLAIALFGRPLGASHAERNLARIKLPKDGDEVPRLLSKRRDGNVKVLEFEARTAPLSRWLEKRDEVACALNCEVLSMREGRDKRRVVIETARPARIPKNAAWKEEYISREDFVLVLGVGGGGVVSFDLSKIPHVLVGGSTGSGKTVLLKTLVHQCKQKGAVVYIADFKGGLDFPADWRREPYFVTEMDALRGLLDNLLDELESRKVAYAGFPGHVDASSFPPSHRMVLACDEIAEILDKTGLSKEEKAAVADVEAKLATIARMGRAFGIHLVLGTQRPEADVLKGQIKSNIGMRICGRADEVLSRIVLDSPEASRIPKDSQGRFMMADGTEFQAFNFSI